MPALRLCIAATSTNAHRLMPCTANSVLRAVIKLEDSNSAFDGMPPTFGSAAEQAQPSSFFQSSIQTAEGRAARAPIAAGSRPAAADHYDVEFLVAHRLEVG